MPELSLSYHVVVAFDALLKQDGSSIYFLPGESVFLGTVYDNMVIFESAKGTCTCDRATFRFATMKLLSDYRATE
jgi:hypothetical protein